jgi:inorganic pyrophosphatase
MHDDFWSYLDQLVAATRVVVDRPRGSAHPRYPDVIYPVDYGYLEGMGSTDGADLDVWVGTEGSRHVGAVICTVDLTKRDAELKLLLGCTEEEVAAILNFTNEGSMRGVLIRR